MVTYKGTTYSYNTEKQIVPDNSENNIALDLPSVISPSLATVSSVTDDECAEPVLAEFIGIAGFIKNVILRLQHNFIAQSRVLSYMPLCLRNEVTARIYNQCQSKRMQVVGASEGASDSV